MSDSQQLRLKLCLIKYELDINKFLNCSFSSVVFCLFAKVTFLHQKQRENYQNQTLFKPETLSESNTLQTGNIIRIKHFTTRKTNFHPYSLLDLSLKGTGAKL